MLYVILGFIFSFLAFLFGVKMEKNKTKFISLEKDKKKMDNAFKKIKNMSISEKIKKLEE